VQLSAGVTYQVKNETVVDYTVAIVGSPINMPTINGSA
jgi:hypothetical protein